MLLDNYRISNLILPVLVILCIKSTFSAPGDVSYIVSSTERPKSGDSEVEENGNNKNPTIYELDITSNITNRFSKTLITNKVKNPAKIAKEATFSIVLPEKAFISEFVMEIGGKSYKAYVKEKEEAKNIYDTAVSGGQSAAHVAVSARDSNRFTVSVNVEAEGKATFLLTYEELLERKNNQYELVINIHPGQVVKELNVQVNINETRPLVFVKTPSLRSGNEISKNEDKLDPDSFIEIINSTSAVVKFQPDGFQQKEYAKELNKEESEGISGQFVVQYDVERDPRGGEVLLQDGYFVHFFAPKDMESLPKTVFFVLDTSSSMYGVKIQQLKDAISSILDEMKSEDQLSIIEFNSETFVWNLDVESRVLIRYNNYQSPFEELSQKQIPAPTQVTKDIIDKTKRRLVNMAATGGTFIIGGLDVALYLAKAEIQKADKRQPMIIFLTDGEPNIGLSSTSSIIDVVTRLNKNNINVPIFSLSFGDGADKAFLRKLSLNNLGFSRHIYDAADASIQLQEFYKQISSPLLKNVDFKYESDAKELTKTSYPLLFNGGEIVVAGVYKGHNFNAEVDAIGRNGPVKLTPKVQEPVTSLERLWAYLTVKETLDKREAADNKKELTKKALDLALKYSFVTDVTSLVVVKPNATHTVNTEDASKPIQQNRPLYLVPVQPLDSRIADMRGGFSHQTFRHSSQSSRPSDYGAVPLSASLPATRRPTRKPLLTTSVATIKKSSLENSLTWLSTSLNPNGTLTLPAGTFKLGDALLNIIPTDGCPKTPKGHKEGLCVLIKDCPDVFPLLPDFDVYKQFSCVLQNEYAGVCCPKKSSS